MSKYFFKRRFSIWHDIWIFILVLLQSRGRAGDVSPRHVLLTIYPRFYSQRVQKPLQRTLLAVFCTELCLIHRIRLV